MNVEAEAQRGRRDCLRTHSDKIYAKVFKSLRPHSFDNLVLHPAGIILPREYVLYPY